MLQKIKQTTALLALICFFLPLSQCSPFVKPDPNMTEEQFKEYVAKEEKKSKYRISAVKEFEIKEPETWPLLMFFIWPIIITFAISKLKNIPLKILVSISPLLAIITLYYILQTIFIGRPMYGGYLWLVSMVVFMGASCVEVVRVFSGKGESSG